MSWKSIYLIYTLRLAKFARTRPLLPMFVFGRIAAALFAAKRAAAEAIHSLRLLFFFPALLAPRHFLFFPEKF